MPINWRNFRDSQNTELFLFREPAAPEPKRTEAEAYRELILENISYEDLKAQNPLSVDMLDERAGATPHQKNIGLFRGMAAFVLPFLKYR